MIKLFIKALKIVGGIILSIFSIFVIVISFWTITEYRPARENILTVLPNCSPLNIDRISILTWNIGYAGLSGDTDFFYEGGKSTRTSEEQTNTNLAAIGEILAAGDADIIMIQEIDINSRRSYRTDQVSALSQRLPDYCIYFGRNFNTPFVPLPPADPTGKIESGLAVCSKFVPKLSGLYSYPAAKSWPMRLFVAKPCFMIMRYKLSTGNELAIVNTHNSAYDDGDLRTGEMNYLRRILIDEYNAGNYVIAGGDWNQIPPGYNDNIDTAGTEFFKPLRIADDFLPEGWRTVTDGKPTNRYLYQPYKKGITKETILDFFVVSPNVKVLKVETKDLGYRFSDHNPVEAIFELIK